MKPQSEIIKEIDEKSEIDEKAKPASMLRLIFIAPLMLIYGLILKGGLFMGVKGLKQAVNQSAAGFVTEAKRYEKDHGDKTEQKRASKDFYKKLSP